MNRTKGPRTERERANLQLRAAFAVAKIICDVIVGQREHQTDALINALLGEWRLAHLLNVIRFPAASSLPASPSSFSSYRSHGRVYYENEKATF